MLICATSSPSIAWKCGGGCSLGATYMKISIPLMGSVIWGTWLG